MNEKSKIPPQAVEIEKAVLGALLIDAGAYDNVKLILKAEHFYNTNNGIIYGAIGELVKAGGKADLLTVADHLRNVKKLDGVGGVSYLAGLTANVGSAAHVKYHAGIIYEKSLARKMISVGHVLSEESFQTDDIMNVITEAEKKITSSKLHFLGLTTTGVDIIDAANQSIDEYFIRERNRKDGTLSGIPSTFKTLDKFTGGFQPGQLIVLAGRPGMGKTSIAISFIITAARAGKKIFMASLEMTSERLTDKVICSVADIDHSEFKKGTLSDNDRDKAERSLDEISSWNVKFNDEMISNIDQIHAVAKSIKERAGLDYVVIDYLQLIRSRERVGNREQEVASISRAAKMLAVELEVPVLLLAQLNRGVEQREDKRPMLSDLRESGAIEQDADIVLFAYRPSMYDDNEPADIGELGIEKHREGPTGTVLFGCNESLTRFYDRDELPLPPVEHFEKPAQVEIRDFSEPMKNNDISSNESFGANCDPNK
jgi:replicative DNA helicase